MVLNSRINFNILLFRLLNVIMQNNYIYDCDV
jgi:hypothetical protein